MTLDSEHIFYNAAAIALRGDPSLLQKLRKSSSSWEEAYRTMNGLGIISLPDPNKEAEILIRSETALILRDDDAFPSLLREIPYPPLALYIKGDIAALSPSSVSLAIVGTRHATPQGLTLARRFGGAMMEGGVSVMSGLAFGIDAAAHEGFLTSPFSSPGAHAVAVLAGGLSSVYPHSNRHLAREILARGGALVSEYPLMEPTARFALEQNRDVFVLPGNVLHENYRGSHTLIKQGAMLITTPEDIYETYGIVKERSPVSLLGVRHENQANRANPSAKLSHEEALVLHVIADSEKHSGLPLNVDKISAMVKLEPRIVNQALTFLIIKELIEERANGYILIPWTSSS